MQTDKNDKCKGKGNETKTWNSNVWGTSANKQNEKVKVNGGPGGVLQQQK